MNGGRGKLSGEDRTGEGLIVSIDRACRRRVQAHHTATHLLQAALKQLVDPASVQAGSLVDFDRLRFDFHCPRAVSREELERARAAGAVAMFGEKYDAQVRVVDVPGVSMELCGGTHVANTAEIGLFKIVSETGVAAGIRRIEAVAGPAVLAYLNEREAVVRELGDRFKAQPGEIVERVSAMAEELKATGKALAAARAELALAKAAALASLAEPLGAFQLLVARLNGVEGQSARPAR